MRRCRSKSLPSRRRAPTLAALSAPTAVPTVGPMRAPTTSRRIWRNTCVPVRRSSSTRRRSRCTWVRRSRAPVSLSASSASSAASTRAPALQPHARCQCPTRSSTRRATAWTARGCRSRSSSNNKLWRQHRHRTCTLADPSCRASVSSAACTRVSVSSRSPTTPAPSGI
jgi:hypothetical protein